MRIVWIAALAGLITTGCSQLKQVRVEQIENTNYVKMRLKSGETVEGTVVKADPYLLTVLQNDKQSVSVQKATVQNALRKPPVADDFGKGITEEEIQNARLHRNAAIYGIGGGALSFGFSFFAGSLMGHSSANGGVLLVGTALSGTALGTALFIHAGAAKDRREAIEAVRAKRRNVEPTSVEVKPRNDILLKLEEEKRKNEEFQKQREKLLRDLEDTHKTDHPDSIKAGPKR